MPSVLIVDDESLILEIIEEFLNAAGGAIDVFGDAPGLVGRGLGIDEHLGSTIDGGEGIAEIPLQRRPRDTEAGADEKAEHGAWKADFRENDPARVAVAGNADAGRADEQRCHE